MPDRLAVLAQYLLPKQALTTLAGRLANSEAGSLTTSVIRWFIRRYGVEMSEAVDADPVGYRTFNEFFTRPLRAGARPLADADFLCPVDGAISQFGRIERDQIFQAKGHHYSTPVSYTHLDVYKRQVVDCQWACPAHTPVPEYIRLIAAGRYSDCLLYTSRCV